MSLTDPTNNNDWKMWSKHVLLELKRLSDCHNTTSAQLLEIAVELSKLKVKSGVWGLLAGLIPVVILIAVYMLYLD